MNEEFMVQLQAKLSTRERRELESGGAVSEIFSRKQIEQAFIESFQLVGGVPRLALWAAENVNYGEFLNMLIKLAPKDTGRAEGGRTLEYRSNIPPSPLNGHPAPQPRALETITEAEFTEAPHAGNKVEH